MLTDTQVEYLERNHAAAMITTARDGTAHAVRVGVVLVNGKLWSSGTPDRVRTRRLRRDPRATLLVWEGGYGYLTILTRVTILDGPDVADQSVRLFRMMQGRAEHQPLMWNGAEVSEDEFRRAMVEEERLIYEFTPVGAYGIR